MWTQILCSLTYVGFSDLRSCVEVEVDILGSPPLIVRTASVNSERLNEKESELRSCVEVEVDVLGSRPS